jgi:hypothetical protein
MRISTVVGLLESAPKLKWWTDGPNEESWLAADYFDDHLATVSPEYGPTRATRGKPDRWIATTADGTRVGQAATKGAAQKLVKRPT